MIALLSKIKYIISRYWVAYKLKFATSVIAGALQLPYAIQSFYAIDPCCCDVLPGAPRSNVTLGSTCE
jgi:hypothetical protein